MKISDNAVALGVAILGSIVAICVFLFAPDFEGKGPAASGIATAAFTGATGLAGKSKEP